MKDDDSLSFLKAGLKDRKSEKESSEISNKKVYNNIKGAITNPTQYSKNFDPEKTVVTILTQPKPEFIAMVNCKDFVN